MSATELPVVLSSYDPDGRYLCYVTVALNKQRISVEPTQKAASDGGVRLLSENSLYLDDSNLKVCTLQWHYLSNLDTLCVFLGLNNGEVWIYSPAANEVAYKLSTGNSFQVNDIKVSSDGREMWCIDADDFFYKFDLSEFTLKQHFKIEQCVQLNRLCLLDSDSSQLLVASHSIYLVDLSARKVVQTYPGHVSPVTHLRTITKDYFISGAADDRFLNVYDLQTASIKSVLVLQTNLKELSNSGEHSVAATTEDGDVEIFADPLVANITNNKRRGNKSKQSSKKIHGIINKNDKSSSAYFVNVAINRDVINLVWLQNATIPIFAQLQWQDLPTNYDLQISSNLLSKSDRSLYGTELAAATNYREGNARITSGDNFKHVNDAIKEWELQTTENEIVNEQDDEGTESLADKLEATTLSRINVGKKKNSTATTAGTVTVVLSQALQANDHSLLETVLNNRDERVIKDTIFRLKPPLAVILLERLAERIARQTHRQGPLNVWVKWCLIIHGGYLVAIPNLMSSLSSLHSTLKRRSDLLPRLLVLETRLEYTLNKLHPLADVNSYALHEYPQEDEEQQEQKELEDDEEDVEYNEELDDAGLIDDGEEEDDEDEEEDEDDEDEERELVNGNATKTLLQKEDEESDDAGYSDVEME